jgi:hypothetical protein
MSEDAMQGEPVHSLERETGASLHHTISPPKVEAGSLPPPVVDPESPGNPDIYDFGSVVMDDEGGDRDAW